MAYGEDFDSDSELTSLEKLDEEARARAKVIFRVLSASLPEPRQNRYSVEYIYS